MSKLPIIFDGDPGHDDAVALMLALGSGKFDVKGFCTVAGNTYLDRATENALKILDVFEADIPVVVGMAEPFKEQPRPAFLSHGFSGMDGPILPTSKRKPLDINVCDFYKQVIDECGTITVVAVGPLTNVAIFLLSYPDYADKIDKIAIMGGAAERGNQTPAAEFNIWHDPEAAKIVFDSGIPIFMAGLDVTMDAGFDEAELAEFGEIGNKAGKFVVDLMSYYKIWRYRQKIPYYSMHDSVPVAWLINPEIFKTEKLFVDIDLYGEHTRGCTVTDTWNTLGLEPNVEVCFDVDREAFVKMLLDAAKNLK